MNNEALIFIKQPILFKGKIKVYPPSVQEVITDPNFPLYQKILCSSQDEIEDDFIEAGGPLKVYPTPFELLLNNSFHSQQYREIAQSAFQFFLKTEVTFIYESKMIVIGNLEKLVLKNIKLEELVTISEDEFFDFQNIICEVCGSPKIKPPILNEHPKAKEMRRRARYRDKIKAKSGQGLSLFSSLVSICCMGLGINPLNIGEMSYASISSILKKYQEKEKYDLDIRSLLAGGDSKKIKPEYWISNFKD